MRILATVVGLCVSLTMAACSPRTDDVERRDSASGGGRGDTAAGMAGMDHSKMDMGMAPAPDSVRATSRNAAGSARTAAVDPMAGMDHSKMAMPSPPASPSTARPASPGSAGRTTASAGPPDMAGMDHSKMAMGSTPAPTTPRTRAPSAPAGAMAGMDHSRMTAGPGSPSSSAAAQRATAGDEKLQRLVAALLQDSVVRQRVLADTALRRQWADTALRRVLISPP